VKPLHLPEILPHIGGVIIKEGSSFNFQTVTTRKKNLNAGTLFFCLNRNLGNTVTQNTFPPCIIVSDRTDRIKKIQGDATIVKVKNIKEAYKDFLSFYRSLFPIPVIAITGTCGKTTTKEMIRHILTGQYNVKATKGTYNLFRSNSAILTSFEDQTDFGVFEVGVGKTGHLDNCCRCFGPFTAVITNIGADHIERFGSINKYRMEKSKILNGVGKNQSAILNADCQNTLKISKEFASKRIVCFGFGEKADFRAHNIKYSEHGIDFQLTFNNETYSVWVPGSGIHNVYNALAAIAAVHSNGVDIRFAIDRLKTFKHLKRHLEVTKGLKGATIIDDTWNTNSGSIQAALTALNQLAHGKSTIAVIGKISELGVEEENEHKKIARMVIENQINILITIGNTASIISREAIRLGMDPNSIFMCSSEIDAKNILNSLVGPDSVILVKTSMRESFRRFLNELKKIT
jgi:UDP-N-acetylmuramoyl-tripeptide--D-alanyl-D-alanine ligase